MTEYIDLNRRFIKAFNKDNPEGSALQSYLVADLMGFGASLGWGDVLESPISVILGEPGSGKTAELRQQSDKLIANRERAFFIRLDRLVNEPFMSVIGEREKKNIKDWKASEQTAYFFFDSVDESKLRRSGDFLTALQRIRDVFTDQDLMRARLIFSSRISEWRPVTDTQALKRFFPVTGRTEKIEKSKKPGEAGFLGKSDESYEAEPKKDDRGEEADPLVVQILPLDADRVRLYARWRGLTDTDDFIRALDSHHAWEFARRPLDVHALIEFWQTHGRLGSLTELIEHSLSVTLRETEGRESLDLLPLDMTRQGAEALAAAALLCRNMNFRIPDDAFVPVGTSAIDSTSCLPGTWSPAERRSLLTRTLFDGATFGCIRFHHRRTMEYLAASWLSERMRHGCPQDHLEELLFARHQGESILRPSVAPVAAWLANGIEPHNVLVRERLLRSDPSIHLKYGDPELLPVEYKKRILGVLVDRYADRGRVWLDTDPEALARLADPALSPDILAIIRDKNISGGLRADMLLLVRHGRLTDCLEAALEIYADPAEEEDIKHYAVAAIRDCGDEALRRRLAAIAGTQPAIPSGLTGFLCETLCPDIIDASGLADLLRKTERSNGRSFDLPWLLKGVMDKLAPNAAGPFLAVFIELLGTEPYLENGRERRISRRYHWLCEVLSSPLIRLLGKSSLDAREARLAADCIRIIDEDRTYGEGNIDVAKEAQRLSEALHRHLVVKSEYFWQGVERFRSDHQEDPVWLLQVMGYHGTMVETDASDMAWLAEAVGSRETAADRALALRFAFELWQPYGAQWKPWLRLMRTAAKQPGLLGPFWKHTWSRMIFPVRVFWSRNIRNKLLDGYWWTRKGYKLRHLFNRLKDLYLLHRHLNWLYSGRMPHWLSSLSQEAQKKHSSSRWAADDWPSLRRKRGPLVAWATRHGCETTWLKHSPLLPHEKPNPNQTSSFTVAGLCGLQSLWHRGKLDFAALSDADSTRAARYAVNELNGFPDWLLALAAARPQAVRDVLLECMRGEWEIPPEREHVHEVISKLAWQGERYWPLIAEGLLSLLQPRDPRHPHVLSHAMTILVKAPDPPKPQLTALASRRAADYQPGTPFFVAWTALWLQLDARGAMDFLSSRLGDTPPSEAERVVLQICNALSGANINRLPDIPDPDYLRPEVIITFVSFIYHHVRPGGDVTHESGEAYSPSDRDHAQRFRDALLQRLAKSDRPEVLATLKALRDAPELAEHRDWISHLVELNIMNAADLVPWFPEDIRIFAVDYEIDPRNDTDLYRIACWRLQDIRQEVERSENSLRTEVHRDWSEAELRQWFQRKLNERSRRRYSIPQEAEIDQRQRPDLRFENPRVSSAVPVELKWAENWTAAYLLERLENQLVGQYLRAYNIRYGIYLLGYIGKQQHWQHPSEQRMVNFDELVRIIEQRAIEIVRSRHDVADIRVIPIDFTVGQ